MERIKNFIIENRVAIIVGICILLFAGWLYKDHHRNDGVYHDTDSNLVDIDKRIQSIEGRLDSMSNRLDENQKAVNRIAEGIGRSRENAEIVAGGIDQAEGRLDSAIQRSQRIEEIIAEIERTNKQGEANP